jgi:hypothetical protein
MRTAKEIAVVSLFVALLIGGQLALSMISGIEVVTVLAVTFCYRFGFVRGAVALTAFSLLRCFLFGFMPNVIILYLLFYNILALVFSLLGRAFNRKVSVKAIVCLTVTAVIFTVFFTALDNVVTPMFYGFSNRVWKIYATASFATVIPQVICSAITVPLLSYPLIKIFKTIKLPQ